MIYRIKEKLWSFGDAFTITDENEKAVFQVKEELFSWGKQLYLLDLQGNELAFIKQKLFSFKPTYHIYIADNLFAEIRKEFSWFNKTFTMDIPGPNDYLIEGSFWKHDYKFCRKAGVVAAVSKKMFSWTDSYAVQINDGENTLSILCACIVIDQVLHDEKNS